MKKTIFAMAALVAMSAAFATGSNVRSSTSTNASGGGNTWAVGETSRRNPVVASGALEGGFSGAAAGSTGAASRNGTSSMSGGLNVEGTGGVAGATRGAQAGYEGGNSAGYKTNVKVTNAPRHHNSQ